MQILESEEMISWRITASQAASVGEMEWSKFCIRMQGSNINHSFPPYMLLNPLSTYSLSYSLFAMSFIDSCNVGIIEK